MMFIMILEKVINYRELERMFTDQQQHRFTVECLIEVGMIECR